MPSIAAASYGGEERVAHTGAAVTRPTAASRETVTASTRSGQPAAAQAARQPASASAAGTSEMKWRVLTGTG